MSTLDQMKNRWQQKEAASASPQTYTGITLGEMIRKRVSAHTKESMKYFWASFTLELIVYGLLAHVIIKYGQNSTILYLSIAGILLYIPFTVVLMRKFKKLAINRPVAQETGESIHCFIKEQLGLLRSFYRFKKWYEIFLIPISCALGVFLVFELYFTGGVREYAGSAVTTFLLSLFSCAAAIYTENRKSFTAPIAQLQDLLKEFEQNEEE